MAKFEFWRELVLVKFMEEGVSYYAKHIANNGFLPKRIGFWCLDVEMLKRKIKNLQDTGGTLGIHRRNPNLGSVWSVGPNLGYPGFALAEPKIGIRLIRQEQKN